MSELKTYFWVPEEVLFESAGDCLDKFPDLGAAALVVSHVAFEKLQHENQILRNGLLEIKAEAREYSVYPYWETAAETLKAADAVRDGE